MRKVSDELPSFTYGDDWTAEEWAQHDAKVQRERESELARELSREANDRLARYEDLGWPVLAIEAALTADTARSAIAAMEVWDVRSKNIAVIAGAAGCGKTTAAAWWSLHRSGGIVPRFTRASAFARGSRFGEERAELLKSRALVLDDLGSEDKRDGLLTDLDELVDTFYGNKRPFVITTNCTAGEFKARYGVRILDRLRQRGTWLAVTGGSLRTSDAPAVDNVIQLFAERWPRRQQ
jgi:DNA replication protein DnaC